jgi:hypothetical protein
MKTIFFLIYIYKMGGGMLQISAYGSQDVYLTGNPQITFFKSVYRRHTNFSMESFDLSYEGTGSFGQNINCKIERVGDLLSNLHVYVKLPAASATFTDSGTDAKNWVNAIGYALLEQIDLEIGGERVDRQYGLWLDIWNELDDVNNKEWDLVGKVSNPKGVTNFEHDPDLEYNQTNATEYYIPLRFWFCGRPGLALPLIALQHQDINLKINIRAQNQCVVAAGTASSFTGSITEFKIYGDYIYLDVDERRKFASQSHEYLIEQLQKDNQSLEAGKDNEININFNHPCKDIVWVFQDSDRNVLDTTPAPNDYTNVLSKSGNDWFNYNGSVNNTNIAGTINNTAIGNHTDPFSTANLKFNGVNRFSERPPSYFKKYQPLTHYDNVPEKNIYCYSFAVKPCEHQPSGTCNFSRLDNASLNLNTVPSATNGSVTLFTRNYNVLRVASGMSALAYNN